MSTDEEKLNKALQMLENAEASLKAARELFSTVAPEAFKTMKAAASTKPIEGPTSSYEEGENQIVEGYFDGQNMIGPNEKTYPVPANYASKSKMVEGDRLKLTILHNGTFLYKQIAPIEREHVKGTLVKENGQYRVLVNDNSYRVILASVTYYKGEVGDEVTLIVPKDRQATWGAVEAILPGGGVSADESELY